MNYSMTDEQLEIMASKMREKERIETVHNPETSVKEQLMEIEKKLIETRSVLMNIVEGITNSPRPDGKLPDEECMQDSLLTINGISDDCMGMANRIHQLLF